MPLQLLVCGIPELLGPDGSVLLKGQRRPRAMALLILLRVKERGQPIPRAALPRQLWAEPERDAGVLTRNAVHDLGKLLGNAFSSTEALRVDPAEVTCDLDDLTLALAAVPSASIGERSPEDPVTRVIALYRGDFLDGWTRAALLPASGTPRPGAVAYGAPFVDWIETQRIALRTHVRERLLDAATAAADADDWARVRTVTEFLRARMRDAGTADPRIWPLEMRAAMAAGDQLGAEALRQSFLRSGVEAPAVHTEMDRLRTPHRVADPVPPPAAPSVAAEHPSPEPAAGISSERPHIPVADAAESLELPRPKQLASPRASRRWAVGAGAGLIVLVAAVLSTRLAKRLHASDASASVQHGSLAPCTAATTHATLTRHNYQLGAVFKPGRRFTKGWWLLNQGECVLGPGLRLHFVADGGVPLSASRADIPVTGSATPGQELLVEVPMRAPATEGSADEQWALLDRSGRRLAFNGAEEALLAQVRVLRDAPVCGPGDESAALAAASQVPNQTLIAGRPFVGAWALRNDGRCTWPAGMRFSPASARVLSGTEPPVTSDHPVGVGELYTFRVDMRAPETPEHYHEAWQLADPGGRPIPVSGDPTVSLRIASVPASEMSNQTMLPPCGQHETHVGWIGETPEDSAAFAPGAAFRKTWTVVNTGSCRWERLYLRFHKASTIRMSATDEVGLTSAVYPNTLYGFDVPMRAPRTPGAYRETWELRDQFGDSVLVTRSDTVWVIIRVPRQR